MIETVVSANMLIGEVMRVKKNHLAPDFPTGNEKRLCIVSGIHGDEVAGQYICYELIRRIKKDFDKLTGIVDVYPFINPMGLEAQYRDVPVFDIDMNTLFPGSKDGTVGEYTAAKVMKDIEGADICVDVHSSSVYIKEIPQVRVNSDVASDLAPYVACMNVDVVFVNAESSGIFLPVAKHSEYIQQGEIIGRIVNVLTGSVEETIRSPRSGIVFSLREYPVIEEGSLVARIFGGGHE